MQCRICQLFSSGCLYSKMHPSNSG
uniref:Uncharacterized protein n=1 Tax=Anguilla anguilla TaxID=7936 RepID=A0A0E9SH85_ANGAN